MDHRLKAFLNASTRGLLSTSSSLEPANSNLSEDFSYSHKLLNKLGEITQQNIAPPPVVTPVILPELKPKPPVQAQPQPKLQAKPAPKPMARQKHSDRTLLDALLKLRESNPFRRSPTSIIRPAK